MGAGTRLATLLHHRWAVPILAELHKGKGAKVATLVRRLGAPRDSVRRALSALVEHGLARKNPGYGHPMRPEYLLTPAGSRIAPACARLHVLVRALRVEGAALRKWSLPVVAGLRLEIDMAAGGGRRGAAGFNDLKRALPGITSRALALALKALQDAGLVEREVVEEAYPPKPLYRLTPRGRRLAPAVAAADSGEL